MLIVQKYGGSSLADINRIQHVARRIVEAASAGNQVVAVLSAQGDTTDDLLAKAHALSARPSGRELDMLMATGEQQSVALMAIAIHELGTAAVSLHGGQAGIQSSSIHQDARIKKIDTARIETELNKGNIVLVAGFQGFNRHGDVTTLGRGGSDTTAVALAAALSADLCEIYTDVSGVFTVDPRIVKTAKKINKISYDEMLEMASLGAAVLHNRSVELANKYNVKLVVRSSLAEEEGTLISKEVSLEHQYITGIAVDKNVARVAVVALPDVPGIAYRVFSFLAQANVCVDIILQSIGRNKTKDISFTVSKLQLQTALETLEANRDILQYDHISTDSTVAKLSVIGAGIASNVGVAATMFEALAAGSININMISSSEIKISVLIAEDQVEKAANRVHELFMERNIEIAAVEN